MKRFGRIFWAFYALAVVVFLVGLMWSLHSPKHFRLKHDADEISAVYIVRTNGGIEESAEVSSVIVQEMLKLRTHYSAPPQGHMTDPYIRIVFNNGDEEWISQGSTYEKINGRSWLWEGYFDEEDFSNLIEPYMSVFDAD